MANLYITVQPIDDAGNKQSGLDIRLRKTNLSGAYTGTVISCIETPASSGVYISSAIDDDVLSSIGNPESQPIGNFEVWRYVSGSPSLKLIANTSVGASLGVLEGLASLADDIAGKANSSHTHSIANITGLQTALDDLDTAVLAKANASHTHAISDVTGLQTALDGKSATSHTHSDYYTKSEIVSKFLNPPGKVPQFADGGDVQFFNSDGITDKTLIPFALQQGLAQSQLACKFDLGITLTECTGNAGGYLLDMGLELYSDQSAFNADSGAQLAGSLIYVGGSAYEIESVEWNSALAVTQFNIVNAPNLSSISAASANLYAGSYYEIIAMPKYSGVVSTERSLKFLVPAYSDGAFRNSVYIPLEVGRDYKLEARGVKNGVRSSYVRSIASYIPTVVQGTSAAGNVTLEATDFGVTVNIANTGDWANADSFEIVWATGAVVSFTDFSYRRIIQYATKYDILLRNASQVTVGVRPLQNGIVIAPAVTSQITATAIVASASEVSITDAGGAFTATNVEDALAEIMALTGDGAFADETYLDDTKSITENLELLQSALIAAMNLIGSGLSGSSSSSKSYRILFDQDGGGVIAGTTVSAAPGSYPTWQQNHTATVKAKGKFCKQLSDKNLYLYFEGYSNGVSGIITVKIGSVVPGAPAPSTYNNKVIEGDVDYAIGEASVADISGLVTGGWYEYTVTMADTTAPDTGELSFIRNCKLVIESY